MEDIADSLNRARIPAKKERLNRQSYEHLHNPIYLGYIEWTGSSGKAVTWR